jgi:phospholipid-binding lipoprotein MlaA
MAEATGADGGCFRRGAVLAALFAVLLAGCTTRPTDPEDYAAYRELNDPFEPANRAVFAFNMALDGIIVRPLAIGYRALVPDPVRSAARNFIDNLGTPLDMLNNLLQGEIDRAGHSMGRFLTNTILGLGGLIDIASDAGIPRYEEDFGQTLAVWGVAEGPYIVLPLIGPSNPRDGIGLAVDTVADPFTYWAAQNNYQELSVARTGVDLIDQRSQNIETIDQLRESSIDFYAAVRSFYRQYRKSAIRNGRASDDEYPPMADFDSMDMEDEEYQDGEDGDVPQ